MPANLENSAVATGLEKVSFHSNPKERQCQRMLRLKEDSGFLMQLYDNPGNIVSPLGKWPMFFKMCTLHISFNWTFDKG